MPSNNTENIYATQYGGEGEPIPATKISYDGTGTTIEATNVQGAITEVETDLQSTKETLGDVRTEIRNTWVKKDAGTTQLTVRGDGVKTVGALFNELSALFKAAILALDDDEIIVPKVLFVSGKAWMGAIGFNAYTNETATFNPVFNRTEISSSALTENYAKLSHAENSSIYYQSSTVAAGTTTFVDALETVLADTGEVYISYEVYKKVAV